ncbi:MAG: nucleotidyltransferase family protein [Geobacteraceae bacterium]|nr:nucleotidyltransferase family protein [Geobacteraceae bacterium]
MHRLEQLLLDTLNPAVPVNTGQLAGLMPDQWQALLALAAGQRVGPLLWHRLKQQGVTYLLPVEAAATLREALSRNTMRNLRRYGDLRRLLTALQAEQIPVILLKGMYLAKTVYVNMGLREMSDIDLLARSGDHRRITEILAGMGYASPPPSLSDNHLPPMVKKGHACFEIHWNLVRQTEQCSIDPEYWWRQAVPARIAGSDTLVLSPEDLLLHLCLHASYQHQFAQGLRPYCDIAATVAHFASALHWESIVERADEWGCRRGVYLTLLLAWELVGAEIPPGILERLRPEDMDNSVRDIARAQIFNNRCTTTMIPVAFAAFMGSRRIRDKIRIFRQRVFVPKAMLAGQYSLPVDAIRVYGCYLYRIFGLLSRHGGCLNRYLHKDAALQTVVERTNVITAWLASPAPRLRGTVSGSTCSH